MARREAHVVLGFAGCAGLTLRRVRGGGLGCGLVFWFPKGGGCGLVGCFIRVRGWETGDPPGPTKECLSFPKFLFCFLVWESRVLFQGLLTRVFHVSNGRRRTRSFFQVSFSVWWGEEAIFR